MKTIFLASVCPFSGKNVIGLGIAQRLRRAGLRVGYFKPIGLMPECCGDVITDEDAALFAEALGLVEPLDIICPLVVTDEVFTQALRGTLPEIRARIISAYEKVSKGKDIVLVGGLGRLSAGMVFGYPSHQFIRDTGALTLIAEKYVFPCEALDGILHARAVLGPQLLGVVFNRVEEGRRASLEQEVLPFLRGREIEVFGIIPHDPVLAAVPLAEIVEALNAQVLCGDATKDVLIENFLVGAMNVNAALTYFRRTPNKAVITGGDRADIQLAALETDAKCLILTGDLYPNERILTRAERQGVPVLLVSTHTSAALETCERLAGHLSLRSHSKVRRVSEVVERALDFNTLFRRLGLG